MFYIYHNIDEVSCPETHPFVSADKTDCYQEKDEGGDRISCPGIIENPPKLCTDHAGNSHLIQI